MDPVAVEVILENRAECSDAERARAALSEALVAARAPAHGGRSLPGARAPRPATNAPSTHWTVTMTVAPWRGTHTGAPKSVDALIVDDAGRVVARRVLTNRNVQACLPLARAVGAWASLVLDAEMNRAKDDDGSEADNMHEGSPGPVTLGVGRTRLGFSGAHPEGDHAVAHAAAAAPRSVELGSMVYLRNGMTTTGGVAGISPFITVEVAPGWVLRPGLFFGRTTAKQDSTLLGHLGARLDFCRRIPGNYIERRGMEADLCAGVEGGVVTKDGEGPASENVGRLGIGPSANLRGEVGAGVALEVRGLLGANMIHYASQAPLAFASAELGMSVRLP